MKIACLAWGSVTWDPRALPIRRQWFSDGPFGRVEFARKSNDDRVTLVLCEEAEPVRLMWAQMDATELEDAREALRQREGLTAKDWGKDIGSWQLGEVEPALISGVATWVARSDIDAVVWTALRPKFGTDRTPTEDEVVAHLRSLRGARRENAERYVRRTPRQVDTKYRRRIESELGWTPRVLGRNDF
jgi:hypothetical protein